MNDADTMNMISTIETWGFRPRTRSKRCYELATKAMISGQVPEGTEMVFGYWSEFQVPHVWLASPDGRIWEPVTATLADSAEQETTYLLTEYTAYPQSRYTIVETAKTFVRHGYYGDFARWDATGKVTA
ncbi:MAG: hypothetical protein Q8Q02_12600 [Nocardioides sp.]|nr:hypothetical protein [Nocardioides sp.]